MIAYIISRPSSTVLCASQQYLSLKALHIWKNSCPENSRDKHMSRDRWLWLILSLPVCVMPPLLKGVKHHFVGSRSLFSVVEHRDDSYVDTKQL